MTIYNKIELGHMAGQYGFVRDTFEKVFRLKEILKYVNEHEYLREHLLLKGGTAINLTVFNLPRLSVDIDMDYTPNDTKGNMHVAREKITALIKKFMEVEGYQLAESSRFTHSLDAFYYRKTIKGSSEEVVTINCDLIVHSRGTDFNQDNLIAIEMKNRQRERGTN